MSWDMVAGVDKATLERTPPKANALSAKYARSTKRKATTCEARGIGHDFKVTRRGSFGYRKTIFVEVKSGNARLSTTQRNAKRRLGSRYVVERVSAGKRHAHVS